MNVKELSEQLANLTSMDEIRKLITSKLGYSFENEPFKHKPLDEDKNACVIEDVTTIASHAGIRIVFTRVDASDERDPDKFLIRMQKAMFRSIDQLERDRILLIIADKDFQRVHFGNVKRFGNKDIFRRFLAGPEHNSRTAAEQLLLIRLDGTEHSENVVKKIDLAFNREEISERFFKEFEKVFNETKLELVAQKEDEHAAHQFLHALLNRLMFVYFIQRKRWLADGDKEFIGTIWNRYKNGLSQGEFKDDTFYQNWLATLFFSSFNNKHGYENKGLPKNIVSWFKNAPYLDGGLFIESDYDQMGFMVSDAMFARIFDNVLNAYNFTVTEDTPFDQNIAVDPEMLGIVYESLVNTTELSDERSDAGIFYTPRVEVDFMCRRALVEHLAKRTSATREDLYRFVFPEDSEEQNPEFDKDTREAIDEALVNLTVVDPACGSGAFLVGMMQVIVELRKLLWEQAGKNIASFNDFDDRKKIIERSLYGVDVKDWAIAIAQLRLWLTLIEVADDKKLDLRGMKMANEPLLPKLTFRMRVGDSLVQEIAGTTIPLRSARGKLSSAIQRRVSNLKKLKTDFYFNRGNASRHTIEMKELEVYGAILDEKRKVIKDDIQRLRSASAEGFQQDLLSHLSGEEAKEEAFSEHKEKQEKKRQDKIKELDADLKQLDEIHSSLPKKQRLFWSVEFAEVFQQNGGFDVVIGNPPYVSVERIADPFMLEAGETPTTEQKKLYKDKLAVMLEDDWGKGGLSLNKRADLYVYFYLRGLALANENGVFIFITSNSWLDSGFGAGLQEFLLRHARVLAIYDNEAKRSFKNADVNTVIAIFEPLASKVKPDRDHRAYFVMFKRPFEEAATSDTLISVDTIKERASIRSQNSDRILANVVGVTQDELYRAGTETDASGSLVANGAIKLNQPDNYSYSYLGNQWGR